LAAVRVLGAVRSGTQDVTNTGARGVSLGRAADGDGETRTLIALGRGHADMVLRTVRVRLAFPGAGESSAIGHADGAVPERPSGARATAGAGLGRAAATGAALGCAARACVPGAPGIQLAVVGLAGTGQEQRRAHHRGQESRGPELRHDFPSLLRAPCPLAEGVPERAHQFPPSEEYLGARSQRRKSEGWERLRVPNRVIGRCDRWPAICCCREVA